MKKYQGFWVGDDDRSTTPAIVQEWNIKSSKVLDLVENKHTVVQAGGNFGFFPVKLKDHFERVITFEPIEEYYSIMVRNIEERELDIEHYNLGLASTDMNVEIKAQFPGNPGATRLSLSEGDIPCTTVDSLNLDACDLMWIDVEGFEVEAINGSLETIEKFKPVIVLENNGLIIGMEGDLEGSKELRAFMDNLGYKLETRLMRDDVYTKK